MPNLRRKPTSEYDFDIQLPASGTAPYNEITSFHSPDHGQRHENEMSDADNVPSLADIAKSPYTPTGFKWAKDKNGEPTLKPLSENITALANAAERMWEQADERYFGVKADPQMAQGIARFAKSITNSKAAVHISAFADAFADPAGHETLHFERQIDAVAACLKKVDNRLARSFITAIGKQAEIDFCKAGYWLTIHKSNVLKHNEEGNEDASERSLVMCEESRAELIITGQLLDHCRAQSFKINFWRGASGALRLRGWSQAKNILQQQTTASQQAERKRVQEREWLNNIDY